MDTSLFDPLPTHPGNLAASGGDRTSSTLFLATRTPSAASSMRELRSLTPSTPTTVSGGFGTAIDSSGTTFTLPSNGTAPHMICIAQASEEMLLRSGNLAYTLLKQQVALLSRQTDTLQVENSTQKRLYEQMIDRIPQLIGMSAAHADDGVQSGPLTDTTAVHQMHVRDSGSQNPPVLGLNWSYPELRTRPEGVEFTYWCATDYKERAKTGGRPGPHDERINVGQRFIEDDEGNVVSGTVAKEIRDMLRSLLHSLAWSGQAAALQDALTHEARVYIHRMLSRRFPFLLLCDGGAWKINELIKQMYHGFKGSQAKRSKAAPASVKAETTDSNGPFNVPVGSKKRERQGSLLSVEGSPVPAKSARRSAPPPEHANPVTEPLQYATSPPLSVSRGPCETTAPTRLLPVGTAPSPSLAPSADLDPPLTVPTTCPEDNSTTATTQVSVDGGSEAAASTGEAAPPPGTGIVKTDHAIVPVRKPFLTQTPRRSSRLTAGDPPTAGTHIASLTPSLNATPTEIPTDTQPGPVPQVATTTQVSDLNIGATECSNPGMGTSSIAGAITTATSSKGRPHKGTAVKAATRYKPDVISDKNLFMRRMVERDPEALYTDVLTAFDNLTSEELEQLKQDCSRERRQRKESRISS